MLELYRRTRDAKGAKLGAALILGLAVVAIVVPWVYGDPNHSDFTLLRPSDGGPPLPSFAHPLGTDALRRDALSRLAAGGRVSLGIGVVASTLATALGSFVGVLSATLARAGARKTDAVVLVLIDVVLALPFLILVTAIGVFVGHTSLLGVIATLGITSSVAVARVVRARAAEVLARDFVDGARLFGESHVRIAWAHVLPNVMGTAISLGTSLSGAMILAEAVLSYLGVGIEPPRASWGRMLHEAESLLGSRPVLVAAPALAIFLAAAGFFRLGEALRVGFGAREERGATVGRWPIDLVLACAASAALVAVPRPTLSPPNEARVAAPTRGGTLHLATFANVATLDSALAYDEVSVAIGRHVFGRLLTFDAAGKIVPDLAESYRWSTDHRSLTLLLRPDLTFQDGARLEARDVKRSIERAFGPKSACPEASQYAALRGFAAFRSGEARELEGVRVISDRAIEFDLDHPNAVFPSLLTLGFVAPVCPSSAPVPEARSTQSPCGAGPFRVASFEPEERVLLARSDRYYVPGYPLLDAIDWRMNVRATSQRYAFERGKLDFVRDLSAADTGLYASDPRWARQRAWVASTRTYAVFLNTELPPFDDVDVRRAVSLALDPSVLEQVRPGEREADRVVPPALPSASVAGPLRHHDLAAARAAMAKAGYPYDPRTGEGGYPEVIDYLTMAESFEQQAAEVYQQQLAEIGLRVRLDLVNYQTYAARVSRRGTVKMGWAAWAADFPDPSNFFDPMLTSRSIGDTSENLSFFSNAELDRIVAEAERETREAERLSLFARAERIVADEAPWIPTHASRALEVWQPRLRGYVPNALSPLDFSATWLAPIEGP